MITIFLFGPSAHAIDETCIDTITNVEGKDTGNPGNQTGIKSDVLFPDGSDDCVRVSSIGVINGTGQVEFGWVLGFHPKDGNVYTGPGACNDNYYSAPEIFDVWIPIGGDYHCRDLTTDTHGSNVFHTMSASDANGDTSWIVGEGGSTLDTVNVNFDRGNIRTNGERHSVSGQHVDVARAHFKNLQKRVAGSTTWFDLCCSHAALDTDNDYHWVRNSDTDTEVIHD